MTIDLNKNGKDDIDELLEDMHEKFDELDESTKAAASDAIASVSAPIEDAIGIDINGDGVVGSAKDEG